MIVITILLCAAVLSLIEFLIFVSNGKFLFRGISRVIFQLIIVAGFPLFYFLIVDEPINDCCTDSATFAPNHKLSIYIYVAVCVLVFFYSAYRKRITTPILEVFTNCILILGITLNIIIAIQINNLLWVFGNLPIGFMFLYELIKNQKMILEEYSTFNSVQSSFPGSMFLILLKHRFFIKFPLLLILCLPVTIILSSLLLLFGQQPDSMIKVFTETYKHGFSQLDYLCKNIECGGHFLCSVAANGHRKFVHPVRYGERGGDKIICNRQLLIANAFEEIIEEKLPGLHKIIRKNYNKIGSLIHRFYNVFKIKIIADAVYILMKPLELIFLLVIYTCDKKPENRIARQYLSINHKQILSEKIKSTI